MTDFKDGDIVQVVSKMSMDKFPEQGKLAREFYGAEGTPHPFYGMVGFVYDTKPNGQICVFFSKSYTDPEPSNMPGWTGVFNSDELTKVGTAVVHLPYEKLRKVAFQFSEIFAKAWNQLHGTNFKTQDEVMESIKVEGKAKPMRSIRLQASGFSNEAKEHLLDKIKLTAPSQALTWQGELDGNTLNPFIKDLTMGESIAVTALEGDKEIATFDTVFLRCNTINIVNVRCIEVRLEFRNSKTN